VDAGDKRGHDGAHESVIASVSEAIQSHGKKRSWIISFCAQERFGGLQTRNSSHNERRWVVVSLLAMTKAIAIALHLT